MGPRHRLHSPIRGSVHFRPFFSVVLGLGRREEKSVIGLALERAEGVVALLQTTCSCTWSDLWGAEAGSLSVLDGSGRW